MNTVAKAPFKSGLLEGVEAVFFDLFDTLIEVDPERLPKVDFGGRLVPTTAPLVLEEVRKVRPDLSLEDFAAELRRIRQEVTAEKEKSWVEISALVHFRKLVERLGLAREPQEQEALARHLAETHMRGIADATRAVPGARKLLERLRDEWGLPTALISNFDYAPAAQWILDRTGLAGRFDKVVISEDFEIRKPHEGLFEEVLRHFRVRPEAALHVGDTAKADIWGAGRLGMRTVWINKKGGPYPEQEFHPTLTIERLDQLLEHV